MQTFLPSFSFVESARYLDNKRLNKQITECLQILRACTIPSYGWQNHPVVCQWRGYELDLYIYASWCYRVWEHRKFGSCSVSRPIAHASYVAIREWLKAQPSKIYPCYPSWLGYEPYHASHRAALLAKNHNHYSQFGWIETPSINYVWPSKLPQFQPETQNA